MIVSTEKNVAVVGIGSPNGDDQLGWLVVDRLASLGFNSVVFEKLHNPVDILPFLDNYDSVHLVDAAIGMPAKMLYRRLSYSNPHDRNAIQEVPITDCHDIGVDLVLRLAESLEKRTDHVTLWIGNGESFKPMQPISKAGKQAADACVGAITVELCDARDVLY
jgi:hydrogenase maturation protease